MTDLSNTSQRLQSGFSLIEILISMLVIGVGLLGLGGLQVASLKGAGNAHSRNVANMLAMELSDRIRANPMGADAGFYENAVSCSANETDCRSNTSCTPQQTAKFDVQEIMCGMRRTSRREGGVANLLSSGNLQVTSQPGGCTMAGRDYTNAQYQVDISWKDRNVHSKQEAISQDQLLTLCLSP